MLIDYIIFYFFSFSISSCQNKNFLSSNFFIFKNFFINFLITGIHMKKEKAFQISLTFRRKKTAQFQRDNSDHFERKMDYEFSIFLWILCRAKILSNFFSQGIDFFCFEYKLWKLMWVLNHRHTLYNLIYVDKRQV